MNRQFHDRSHAGRLLAQCLTQHGKCSYVIVLALQPSGGPTAWPFTATQRTRKNPEPLKLMITPVQITYRNMQPSAAVSARINQEAARLDRYFPRIVSCRVVVETPHRHHKWGELFHLRIELGVPGADVVIRHEPTLHRALSHGDFRKWSKHFEIHTPHKDVYVTIRDAFKAARRRLEDHARRLRGDVKMHLRAPAPRFEKILAN